MDKLKLAEIIGQRLRLLRISKGLSQSELASKIKSQQRDISNWEKGKRLISTEYLFNVCLMFGVGVDFFDPTKDDVNLQLAAQITE